MSDRVAPLPRMCRPVGPLAPDVPGESSERSGKCDALQRPGVGSRDATVSAEATHTEASVMRRRSALQFLGFVLTLIRLYQRSISPDHGRLQRYFPEGFCRFDPTCSQYAHDAFEQHGLIRGGSLAARRLARCHPWARGGRDAVPTAPATSLDA